MTFSSTTARSLPPPLSARPSPRRPATLCRLLDDATALVRRPPLLRRPCRNGRAPSPTPQRRASTPTPSVRYHVPTHHRPRQLPFPPPAPSCAGGGIAVWEAGGVGEEGDGRNSMATADTARRPFPHRGRRFARREAVAASAEGLQPRRPQRRTEQAVVAIRAATARPRPPQPRRHPPRPAATPLHRHCRVEAAAVRHDGDGRERRGGGREARDGRARPSNPTPARRRRRPPLTGRHARPPRCSSARRQQLPTRPPPEPPRPSRKGETGGARRQRRPRAAPPLPACCRTGMAVRGGVGPAPAAADPQLGCGCPPPLPPADSGGGAATATGTRGVGGIWVRGTARRAGEDAARSWRVGARRWGRSPLGGRPSLPLYLCCRRGWLEEGPCPTEGGRRPAGRRGRPSGPVRSPAWFPMGNPAAGRGAGWPLPAGCCRLRFQLWGTPRLL